MSSPDATNLTIALPSELKQRVKAKAAKEGRNVTDIIMEAFAEYLREDDLQEQINQLRERVEEIERKITQ